MRLCAERSVEVTILFNEAYFLQAHGKHVLIT